MFVYSKISNGTGRWRDSFEGLQATVLLIRDVWKITGRTDEMVNAYDKSARADNASRKMQLVN